MIWQRFFHRLPYGDRFLPGSHSVAVALTMNSQACSVSILNPCGFSGCITSNIFLHTAESNIHKCFVQLSHHTFFGQKSVGMACSFYVNSRGAILKTNHDWTTQLASGEISTVWSSSQLGLLHGCISACLLCLRYDLPASPRCFRVTTLFEWRHRPKFETRQRYFANSNRPGLHEPIFTMQNIVNMCKYHVVSRAFASESCA